MLTAGEPSQGRRSTRGGAAAQTDDEPGKPTKRTKAGGKAASAVQYHDIGKEGRRTGARPPEHVETNRLGVALPRAYLDSPKRGQQDNNSVVDEIEAGIESRVNGSRIKELETPSARFVYPPRVKKAAAVQKQPSSDAEEAEEESAAEEQEPEPERPAGGRGSKAAKGAASTAASRRQSRKNGATEDADEDGLQISAARGKGSRSSARVPVEDDSEARGGGGGGAGHPDHTYSRRSTFSPSNSPRANGLRTPPPAGSREGSPELVSNGPSQQSVANDDAGHFDGGFDNNDYDNDNGGAADFGSSPAASPQPSPPRKGRKSKVAESESPDPTVRRKSRGGARRSIGSDDEDNNDDQPAPYPDDPEPAHEDEEASGQEEEQEEEEQPKPKKKAAASSKPRSKPSKMKRKSFHPSDDEDEDDENGGRRSKRAKFAPLKYWALEKVKYEKIDGTVKPVVEHRESASPEAFRKPKTHRRKHGGAVKEEIKIKAEPSENAEALEFDVIEWMGDGQQGQIAKKKIFSPLGALDLRPVNNETYQFAKAFSEGDFCACGQMLIPSGAEKPTKNTRANAMMFCVLAGTVKATVNNSTFEAKPGDQFLVPRGNQYRLYNSGKKDARLFFAHAREVESVAREAD